MKILLETVKKEPQQLGYEFERWTGKRLAAYLDKRTGIQLSDSQIRRILKRKSIVISEKDIAKESEN